MSSDTGLGAADLGRHVAAVRAAHEQLPALVRGVRANPRACRILFVKLRLLADGLETALRPPLPPPRPGDNPPARSHHHSLSRPRRLTPEAVCAACAVYLRAALLVRRLAGKSVQRQALLFWSSAATLAHLDAAVTESLRTLGSLVDSPDIPKATELDHDGLASVLLEQPGVVSSPIAPQVDQHLETLDEIDRSLRQNLARGRKAPAACTMASGAAMHLALAAGRGIATPRPWMLQSGGESEDLDVHFGVSIGRGTLGDIFRGLWEGRLVDVQIIEHAEREACSPQRLSSSAWLHSAQDRITAIDDVESMFCDPLDGHEPAVGGVGADDGSGGASETAATIAHLADAWSSLDHPNVLKLWRVCLNARTPFIVTEATACSLADHLRGNPDTPIAERIRLIADVAAGMEYLAALSPPMSHGSLRAETVRQTADGRTCVAGFGLAFDDATHLARTVRWAPPHMDNETACSADVFAFAMLAAEVLSGDVPMRTAVREIKAMERIARGRRPQLPHGTPVWLAALLARCWDEDPAARPQWSEISQTLGGWEVLVGLDPMATEPAPELPESPASPVHAEFPSPAKPAQPVAARMPSPSKLDNPGKPDKPIDVIEISDTSGSDADADAADGDPEPTRKRQRTAASETELVREPTATHVLPTDPFVPPPHLGDARVFSYLGQQSQHYLRSNFRWF
ncbi:U1 snRNP protein [Polyrhizophydium stewartii]|uniref:U1 snRNP protein n=1 Tax=Polyrhizophydium stewartii TaxID=2732419 RepID=A0ABR4MVV2_9FUNG